MPGNGGAGPWRPACRSRSAASARRDSAGQTSACWWMVLPGDASSSLVSSFLHPHSEPDALCVVAQGRRGVRGRVPSRWGALWEAAWRRRLERHLSSEEEPGWGGGSPGLGAETAPSPQSPRLPGAHDGTGLIGEGAAGESLARCGVTVAVPTLPSGVGGSGRAPSPPLCPLCSCLPPLAPSVPPGRTCRRSHGAFSQRVLRGPPVLPRGAATHTAHGPPSPPSSSPSASHPAGAGPG